MNRVSNRDTIVGMDVRIDKVVQKQEEQLLEAAEVKEILGKHNRRIEAAEDNVIPKNIMGDLQ